MIPATVNGIDVSDLDTLGKKYVIGDDTLHSNDAEKAISSNSYEKDKEIRIDQLLPQNSILRIKFDLTKTGGGGVTTGRIYKNGVAYGTERSRSSDGWETFSEDLRFLTGDTIELWCKYNFASANKSRNFRVHGSEDSVDDFADALSTGFLTSDPFIAVNTLS